MGIQAAPPVPVRELVVPVAPPVPVRELVVPLPPPPGDVVPLSLAVVVSPPPWRPDKAFGPHPRPAASSVMERMGNAERRSMGDPDRGEKRSRGRPR
jgi:hypothetical protein